MCPAEPQTSWHFWIVSFQTSSGKKVEVKEDSVSRYPSKEAPQEKPRYPKWCHIAPRNLDVEVNTWWNRVTPHITWEVKHITNKRRSIWCLEGTCGGSRPAAGHCGGDKGCVGRNTRTPFAPAGWWLGLTAWRPHYQLYRFHWFHSLILVRLVRIILHHLKRWRHPPNISQQYLRSSMMHVSSPRKHLYTSTHLLFLFS